MISTRGATVEDEARAWLVRLGTGGAQSKDRTAFEHWRAEDPEHAAAYARAARLWNGLAAMPELADLEPLERLTLRERFAAMLEAPRQWLWAAPAAAAAILIAVFFIATPTRYATGLAEVRELRLPDGSIVTLGAKSALQTDFSSDARKVILSSGEAYFAIAPDAARPFTVAMGDTVVRVLGTRFNVNRSSDNIRIDVIDGLVQVSSASASGAAGAHTLAAGQRLIAVRGAPLHPVHQAERAQPDAWREGRLVYFDAPLADIAADANRYYAGRIVLDSPALGALRLTASFRTSEIEGLIDTLDSALPLRVERRGAETILHAERPPD